MGGQRDTHPGKANERWRAEMSEPSCQEKCDIGVRQIESIDRVISKIIPGVIECHEHDCPAHCIDLQKPFALSHRERYCRSKKPEATFSGGRRQEPGAS
jgi:hypothetical protein